MFITFEGIDYSGKSTQCQLLVEFLIGKGYDVVSLREPGGTQISEKIRKLLLDNSSDGMTPLAEFLLYSAARAQLAAEVIKPALESGKTVICDRFYDSSTAYQGYGRRLDIENVEKINDISSGGLKPDLTIIVDIPVETAVSRLKSAGKLTDRIESENKEFFEQVRQGYLQLATRQKDRVKVVDGSDDITNVRRRVEKIVVEKFRIK